MSERRDHFRDDASRGKAVAPAVRNSAAAAVRSPRQFRARSIFLLCTILFLLAVCSGLTALTCRPSWYAPRSLDYHALDGDKRAQIRLENTISRALNAGRAEEVVLSQDLVNRWIAARHELWPGEAPSLEPFSRPLIILEDGNRVRVAATIAYAGLRCVVSATFRVELDQREIRVLPDSAQAGVFPVPELLVENAVRKLIGEADAPRLDVHDRRLVLRNEWIWPNGKRLFRVAALSISGGELRATLEPLE